MPQSRRGRWIRSKLLWMVDHVAEWLIVVGQAHLVYPIETDANSAQSDKVKDGDPENKIQDARNET
jgi:hypothetical protein